MNTRVGTFIKQLAGYTAFIPKPLPPEPPVQFDDELHILLSEADRALARLDGIITVLPNPNLFIGMYVKKEALLSSQIEGTQASLEGILEFEADLTPKENIEDIKEVINYIKALNYGIEMLKEQPMSLRLIKDIHNILIEETRGSKIIPGEFRKSQNWIGPQGASLSEAIFVPPPPEMVLSCMGEIEKFFYEYDHIPPLVKIALIHAQFETIHPFLDGNGRIGRLLITFYLFWKKILSRPVLYLSFYLKKHRSEYYDLLMKVRTEGAWEDWIKFFLKGVFETSSESANTAKEIIKLKEDLITKLYENSISSIYAIKLIDHLFENPLTETKSVMEKMKIHKDTANELVKAFEKIGILKEITGKQRYKKYLFKEYVNIISRGTEL
ncbi:MAG: Adenosine monophosphate-protein transferase SoFic [candidate division WS2 bacterium]|uniref:Adenosine monophosphate-protein transferase SoFic n=1 Tax=Psychracetigena formicireducens TaxID=2986056 RepID=A0A9E2BGN3_PSYF1|nr:Adenosine monophosphate-protein transferase SoFic [Candidatus Psychracetigena formicireducens]MBT9145223.1 Adenosine monophosphate-protein transferase SoFic [Candidatus Psychracetigena formicireducens]